MTELHDPEAMELTYNDLLVKSEDIYYSVTFTFDQAVMVEEHRVKAELGLTNVQAG